PVHRGQEGLRSGRRLDVRGDGGSSRVGESLPELQGVLEHQVGVHRERGQPSQGLHVMDSQRQVGDEMAVHDVQVDAVRSGVLSPPEFPLKAAEVGRQDGGGELHRPGQVRVMTRPSGKRISAEAWPRTGTDFWTRDPAGKSESRTVRVPSESRMSTRTRTLPSVMEGTWKARSTRRDWPWALAPRGRLS